jgi:aspartate carbamoyltransferase catalytic subunit
MTFCDRHLLGIEQLDPTAIFEILSRADSYVDLNRQAKKKFEYPFRTDSN